MIYIKIRFIPFQFILFCFDFIFNVICLSLLGLNPEFSRW